MRILVVSNLYPPYYVGGYELGCYEVVEGLKARGHTVNVLTSSYGVERPLHNGEIYRWLEFRFDWNTRVPRKDLYKLLKKERTNQRAFERLSTAFKPDIIYVWNLTHVSISIVFTAQRQGFPVGYFVFDNWLAQWENDPWYYLSSRQFDGLLGGFLWRLLRLLGLPSAPNSLDLRNVQFASQYLKQFALQAGKPVSDAKVVGWGVDVHRFPYKKFSHNPKRLLYVGQVLEHKGIHTAVRALKVLVQRYRYKSLALTIAGGSLVPEYEASIRGLVSALGLSDNVCFAGFVPHEYIAGVYQEHDILIFPSVWDEPFGITLLEAMSSGLAVVGTATGGSAEILENEVNALVFPEEDAEACACQILRLVDDPDLFERIRQNGSRLVEERFNLEDTLDQVEKWLYQAIA